jgi:hypothetical protein
VGNMALKFLIIYNVTGPESEPRAPEYKTGDGLIILR